MPCFQTNQPQIISAKGVVKALDGSFALVFPEVEGCGRCDEPGGCGRQKFSRLFSTTRTYRVPNDIEAKVGDSVQIELTANLVREAAGRAYVLPLLLFLACAVLGDFFWGDLGAIFSGVLGLLASLWLLRQFSSTAALRMSFDT